MKGIGAHIAHSKGSSPTRATGNSTAHAPQCTRRQPAWEHLNCGSMTLFPQLQREGQHVRTIQQQVAQVTEWVGSPYALQAARNADIPQAIRAFAAHHGGTAAFAGDEGVLLGLPGGDGSADLAAAA